MHPLYKSIIYFIVPGLLLLLCVPVVLYSYNHRLFQLSPLSLQFERYSVSSGVNFGKRFQFKQSLHLNPPCPFSSRHNLLLVEPNYTIPYQNQVDLSHIKWVRQPKGGQDTYLIVQYNQFSEIIYLTQGEGQVCLEMEIGESKSVVYSIDQDRNIWIITIPMNKLLLVQVYSCINHTLLHKRMETLTQPLQQILQVIDIDGQMHLQGVTYSLSLISINLSDFKVISTLPAYEISSELSSAAYSFYEPPPIYKPSPSPYPLSQPILHFIVEYLTVLLNFQSLDMYHESRVQTIPPVEPVHIPSQLMDAQSNYVLLLDQNSSLVTQLDEYLIPTLTPVFHSIPNYDIHSIVQRQPVQFSYVSKQLIRSKLTGVFPVYPNNKVHFMSLSASFVHLYPGSQQEQYFMVRTKEGGMVSKGVDIKGIFEKIPLTAEQTHQIPMSKPDEPLKGIHQIHAGYRNLFSILKSNKLELISQGKSVFSHFLTHTYTSALLLNNQWWILQYDSHTQSSIATKYQLYLNASNPTVILHLKAIYGKLHSQDELALLMDQYTQQYGHGYILLSVFRCIDQYYYFQYSSMGNHPHYGVARIHYQSLSNRRVKANGGFAKKMAVSDDMLIETNIDRTPYAVLLHIPLLKLPNPALKWHNQCRNKTSFLRLEPTSKSLLAPIRAYSIGSCGSTRINKINSTIVMINMRSLIEQAIHQPYSGHIQRQRNTALAILSTLPLYFLLLICFGKKAFQALHEKEE